jgi:hypothetical protein
MRPSIVVVGSGSAGREYDPPLADQPRIPTACQEIGRELARAGCDLVVFSSDADFVEVDVVRGYLDAANDAAKVAVRAPHQVAVRFDVPDRAVERVHVEPDTAGDWESSYYRSVFEADGLVAIGGGRSTRIAGVLAIAQGTPVVALAAFGGGASVVWRHLDKHRNDATAEDVHLMGRPWGSDSARLLVQSLLAQRDRREATERLTRRAQARIRRSRTLSSLTGVAALLLAAATILVGGQAGSTGTVIACLLAGPMLGAVGGAMLRDTADDEPNAVWSAARGLGAGMLASMLYVASQLLTNPDLLAVRSASRLLWFVVPLGIAAGYTFDLVYAKLHKSEVLPGPDLGGKVLP